VPIGDVDAAESTPEHVIRKIRDEGARVGNREEVAGVVHYRVTPPSSNAPMFTYFYADAEECRKAVAALAQWERGK
jgi:hypothetical protein